MTEQAIGATIMATTTPATKVDEVNSDARTSGLFGSIGSPSSWTWKIGSQPK